MRKYSYPYLGQLEFSSEVFTLLVDVTTLWVKVTCGKFIWMAMIWKGTHLNKSLIADNAYQSKIEPKNQALRSKACRAQKQVCVKPHISRRVQKCLIEWSQMHLVSVTLNGRSLKQPGLFLDLASWPNWAIDGEGLWLEWWRRSWWCL